MVELLRFKSLSVLDFIKEAEEWDGADFINNCYTHKEQLKKLDVDSLESVYFGCGCEIWHLIDFLRKCLFFNETGGKYPAGMGDEDYQRMVTLFKRFVPDLER